MKFSYRSVLFKHNDKTDSREHCAIQIAELKVNTPESLTLLIANVLIAVWRLRLHKVYTCNDIYGRSGLPTSPPLTSDTFISYHTRR